MNMTNPVSKTGVNLEQTDEKPNKKADAILNEIKGLKAKFLEAGWDIEKFENVLWLTNNRVALFEGLDKWNEIYTIKECIDELKRLYPSNLTREWDTLILDNTEFWFGKNAIDLAENTKQILSKIKGKRTTNSTKRRGSFKFELVESYDWITYIECRIIKQEV